MSGFLDSHELDIAKSIKLIENLKSSVLTDVADLYAQMAKSRMDTEEVTLSISKILIDTYMLGNKLGIDLKDIDKTVINKLKIENLKENNNLKNETKALLSHLDK